jgi:hypothetical protein
MHVAHARFVLLASLVAPNPLAAAPPPSAVPAVPAVALPLRVSHVEIELALDPPRAALQETVSLAVEGVGVSRLVFAIDEGLAVKTSRTSAGVIEHRQAGDALIVDLDPPLDGVRTLTFTIGGQPGRHSESRIGPERAILAPSTPWYPRLDGMWATTVVTVRTPEGWGALAPGAPAPRRPAATSRWVTDRPVRSIAVAAAPGLRVADGTVVATPLRVATVGGTPSASVFAQRLTPGMAWLSGALAPYPFDAFNIAVLPGFTGRVDASGMTIIGRDAPLATDSDGADLLAGQWWGQRIGGDGAWIASFAAWESCVFARDRALPIPTDIAALRTAYFQLRSGDVALADAPSTAPLSILRGKGSAAVDMIRLVAGDRATFDAVRELFEAPIGPSLSLARVRAAMEQHAERSLARTFNDWFGRAGAPEFAASLRSFPAANGGFRADVALTQLRGAYALPVEIVIYGPGDEKRETIEVADEITSVFYVVPFPPTRIEVDPLNRIFRWK